MDRIIKCITWYIHVLITDGLHTVLMRHKIENIVTDLIMKIPKYDSIHFITENVY